MAHFGFIRNPSRLKLFIKNMNLQIRSVKISNDIFRQLVAANDRLEFACLQICSFYIYNISSIV